MGVQLIFPLAETKLHLGTGLRGICLRGWRECPMRLSVLGIRLASLQTRAIYLTITSATPPIPCFLSFIENSLPFVQYQFISTLRTFLILLHKVVILYFNK